MPNNIEMATLFQTQLDRQITQDATSNFLEANAGQVIYHGGDTVKIPKIDMDGLADYSRTTGYTQGGVTLSYETFKMTQDRGRSFNIDAMDVDESNFLAAAGIVIGEFQRTKVIPEIDLYRWNKIYTAANGKSHATAADLTKDTIVAALEKDITAVEDAAGTHNGLVIVMNTLTSALLDQAIPKQLNPVEFTAGQIHTQVQAYNDIPIIKVSSSRMKTTVSKDSSTQAITGSGQDIHWLIFPQFAPIAVSKTDTVRIFDPATYQDANAWHIDYRKFHDIWIPENRLTAIYAHTAAAGK